ncbi:hypothetical protein C5S31_11165, partial [ANME-1 cluster archaeon GoMg2]|nr:hypothetical protein [ANME-1 cluster archaeon GoMg2]
MKAEKGFLEELRKSCELQKVNFEEVKRGIEEIVGEDQILNFYILGPVPKFKKTILDIIILTKSYFMRVRLSNPSLHQPLPLNIRIASLTEINVVQ